MKSRHPGTETEQGRQGGEIAGLLHTWHSTAGDSSVRLHWAHVRLSAR